MKHIKIIIWALFFCYQSAFAAKALFAITPIGSPIVTVPLHYLATVNYRVVNQTKQTQTLTLANHPGVTQIPGSGPLICSSPFTLRPNEGCILRIKIDAEIISSPGLLAGPEVCSLNSNFFCSVPDSKDQLRINLTTVSFVVIANQGAQSGSGSSSGLYGFLSFCAIGTQGTLERCVQFNDLSFGNSNGVANLPDGTLLVGNRYDNSISFCSPPVLFPGVSCSNSVAQNLLSSPRTVYLSGNYVYTLNNTSSEVVQCDLTLQTCSSTGSGFSGPTGSMTIANGYAYVPNTTGNNVSVCAVSANDGTFSSCATFDNNATLSSPAGVAIANGYAYIVSSSTNEVVACEVSSSDGTLSNCVTNSVLNSANSSGVSVYYGYLYFTSTSSSQMTKCLLEASGVVSNCTQTGSGFSNASGNINFFPFTLVV
jgi:hypothetical protein